ncbi:metal-binding protein [Aphanothece hegewaldii CCALA 016]|uniref:Metal-binding protein n=1 Tax=Aphanothece hegewaldii CCALA 016 TaxID=2107694 RepID=A0A2T1LXC4_9CHRO|nr:metal-binding protein [Aphanothece hegewaldii]PSF36839.1 metal-binding protein [Aphanothece hegewaldii CCALA 016]
MPSGRTHDRITLWSLPWLVVLSLLLSRSGELTLIISSGFLFSGLMFGPDLDIYSVQYKRWGFLRWIWQPYQSMIRHRSWLSHGLLVGTFVRILYLSSVLILLGLPFILTIQLFWGNNWNKEQIFDEIWQLLTRVYPYEVIALIIGLELGAMSHSISDWLGSSYKRLKRRSKPQKRKKRR